MKKTDLNFSEALHHLTNGRKVFRNGWNGKNMWIKVQMPDQHSKMTEPYIYMSTVTGGLIPWLASQSDLLASDWCVLAEEEFDTPSPSPPVVEKARAE